MTKTDFELIKAVFGDDPRDRPQPKTQQNGTAGMGPRKKQKRDFIVERKPKRRQNTLKFK